MGRHRKPPNAECTECGEPFRSYGCIRCADCREGKQGLQRAGYKGWDKCPTPGCDRMKSYAAKRCRVCYEASVRKPEETP